jgi:DNA-binding GntR family transcriptional regulator
MIIPPKTALKDKAYDAIKKMILFGELHSGQLLNEAELQDLIGIGRTPVREALLKLAQDMLVVIHPRKGIEVAMISPKKINEIFEIRLVLEVSMLRNYMDRLEREWLIELQDVFHTLTLMTITGNDTIRHIVEQDDRFHNGIIRASGNQMAENIMNGFLDYLMLLRVTTTTADDVRHMASEREHIQIIQCILAGDNDAACNTLKEHLEISWKATLNNYMHGG